MALGYEELFPGDSGAVRKGLFKKLPLAFIETPEQEVQRVERLKEEDPITLQDVVNTSSALVDYVKENDLEEVRRLVAESEEGEFLQVFVIQAFVHALKRSSLEMVTTLVDWGVPLENEQLAQSLHLVCEVTNRENFSDAWRIIQLLSESCSALNINTPRSEDGWTPLCVACSDACLPLCFKLLELKADPNVITRNNKTPLALARQRLDTDTEDTQEAREIIVNMLQSYGGQDRWQDALAQQYAPKPSQKRLQAARGGSSAEPSGGNQVETQAVGQTHTRFSA